MKPLFLGAALFFYFTGYSQTNSSFTVHFAFDKYQLDDIARAQLDSFITTVKQDSQIIRTRLHGHCDFIGSNEYNDLLSQNRVRQVHDYLLNHGFNKQNVISITGHGKRNLLNENSMEPERGMNRRVEIEVFQDQDTIQTGDGGSLIEKIRDTTTTTGTNIVLRNINFHGGMHKMLSESYPQMEELLQAMKTFPRLVIRIEGHICCQQGTGDGMDMETGINNLSEARARAIHDYLISQGIAANRVSYKGFGHSVPIFPFPEQSEAERIQNRRVEIKIIRK